MADKLQCLICDHTVEPGEMDEALALMGVSSASATEALLTHMESHTLVDWIKAFKMADAYIAQLEREVEEAKAQQFTYQGPAVGHVDRGPAPPVFQSAFVPGEDEPLAANGQPLSRYLTPAEIARKRHQAEIRRQVEQSDPDESLIPFIAPASRPEGVVGRKM